MKNLVFMFIAMAVMTIASCGNKTDNAVSAQDTIDTVAIDTIDSAAVADFL